MSNSKCHYYVLDIRVYRLLLFIFVMLDAVVCICKIDSSKAQVRCSGKTWKRELLPMGTQSVTSIIISNCFSGNSNQPMKLDFIAEAKQLRNITISNCQLKLIPVIQYPTKNLQSIDLSNNAIHSEQPLSTSIQMSHKSSRQMIIKQAVNINMLNLNNNHLKEVKKSWFLCPSTLQILLLDGNQIAGLDPDLASCFINLRLLSLRYNFFRVLRKFSPNVRVAFNNQLVRPRQLKLQKKNNRKHVKKTRKTSTTNTVDSSLRCQQAIAANAVNPGRHDGIIPELSLLNQLDLSYNCIESLGLKLPLFNFRSLRQLVLRGNRLSSMKQSPKMDVKLSSLDIDQTNEQATAATVQCDLGTAPFYIDSDEGLNYLDLSDNVGIQRIQKCWIFGINKLLTLKMSNCSISTIESESFSKKDRLKKLDLSYNNLREVPQELSNVASNLTHLNLAHNNLSQMTSITLASLKNLQYLNLSHNHYSSMATFLSTFNSDSLKEDLSHRSPMGLYSSDDSSQLYDGDDQPLHPQIVPKMIHLLGQLHQLKVLDLSYNLFNWLSAKSDFPPSLVHPGILRYVNLVGNTRLTSLVDFDARSVSLLLRDFHISAKAPFRCDCQSFGFIEWVVLRNIKTQVICHSPRQFMGLRISHSRGMRTITSLQNICRINNGNNGLSNKGQVRYPLQKQHKQPQEQDRSIKNYGALRFSLQLYSNVNRTRSVSTVNGGGVAASSATEEQNNLGGMSGASIGSRGVGGRGGSGGGGGGGIHSSGQTRRGALDQWVLREANLSFRCDLTIFHPSLPLQFKPLIEWRRQKVSNGLIRDNSASMTDDQLLRSSRQKVKIEVLNTFDPRIKIHNIGPLAANFPIENRFDRATIKRTQAAVLPQQKQQQQQQQQQQNALKFVSYLSLSNVQFSDAASYFCLVNNIPAATLPSASFYYSGGQQPRLLSKLHHVQVFTPPRFTATPSRVMSTIEGETVEIPCGAKGFPPPNTSLGLSGTTKFPAAISRRLVVYRDDSSFFITDVKAEDAGNYSCTSKNPVDSITFQFRLKVQVPATIVEDKSKKHLKINLGDPLIIRFHVNGVPSPKVKWTKDSVLVRENDRVKFSADRLMLVIEKTVSRDAGIYKISVLNGFGDNEASVTVDIVYLKGGSNNGGVASDHPAIRAPAWLGDYWLSGIIVVVVLSILLTSVLWVLVFVCCTRRCVLRAGQHQHQLHQHFNHLYHGFGGGGSTNGSVPTASQQLLLQQQQQTQSIDTIASANNCNSKFYSSHYPHQLDMMNPSVHNNSNIAPAAAAAASASANGIPLPTVPSSKKKKRSSHNPLSRRLRKSPPSPPSIPLSMTTSTIVRYHDHSPLATPTTTSIQLEDDLVNCLYPKIPQSISASNIALFPLPQHFLRSNSKLWSSNITAAALQPHNNINNNNNNDNNNIHNNHSNTKLIQSPPTSLKFLSHPYLPAASSSSISSPSQQKMHHNSNQLSASNHISNKRMPTSTNSNNNNNNSSSSSSGNNNHNSNNNNTTNAVDSGIESSHMYTDTLTTGSDISSVYQSCKPIMFSGKMLQQNHHKSSELLKPSKNTQNSNSISSGERSS